MLAQSTTVPENQRLCAMLKVISDSRVQRKCTHKRFYFKLWHSSVCCFRLIFSKQTCTHRKTSPCCIWTLLSLTLMIPVFSLLLAFPFQKTWKWNRWVEIGANTQTQILSVSGWNHVEGSCFTAYWSNICAFVSTISFDCTQTDRQIYRQMFPGKQLVLQSDINLQRRQV